MPEDIVFFAFRYALGRRTAAPSLVADFIIHHWMQFADNTKKQMADEVMTAINRNQAGADCDIEQWLRIPKASGLHVCECHYELTGWYFLPGCQWHDKTQWPKSWVEAPTYG